MKGLLNKASGVKPGKGKNLLPSQDQSSPPRLPTAPSPLTSKVATFSEQFKEFRAGVAVLGASAKETVQLADSRIKM